MKKNENKLNYLDVWCLLRELGCKIIHARPAEGWLEFTTIEESYMVWFKGLGDYKQFEIHKTSYTLETLYKGLDLEKVKEIIRKNVYSDLVSY